MRFLVPRADPCTFRRVKHQDRSAHRGFVFERPGRLDLATHGLCERLDFLASQGGGVDRKAGPHVVE